MLNNDLLQQLEQAELRVEKLEQYKLEHKREKKKKDKLLLLFFLSPFRRFPFLPRRAGLAFSSHAHLSTHVE